jgi:mono/diheme cytochrome c family protein
MKIRMMTFLLLAASAGSLVSEPGFAQPPSAWTKRMRELYATLSDIIVDTSSEQRFDLPANQKRIRDNARKLAKLAHEVAQKDPSAPDRDPSVQMIGSMFAEDAKRAADSLNWGNRRYARDLLRNTTTYCIACHTRNGSGPSFDSLPMSASTKDLTPSERASFFAATRQYDRALSELRAYISSASAPLPAYWTQAVRDALAIAVRVKRDPAMALEVVDQVLANKNTPFYFRRDASAWRKSIESWKKESIPAQPQSSELLLAEAVRLVGTAREAQRYPADRDGDIEYLRATAVVHELLQRGEKNPSTEQAYLVAGVCYDVLRPFNLNELQDAYFEMCIRQSPRTPLSETCYHRLEQTVYEGFTGSAGMDLPEDVRARLSRFEAMAKVPATGKPPAP